MLLALSLYKWIIRTGDAASQFANAALLGGHPNESISGRSHRQKWPIRHPINWAFRLILRQQDHCQLAYQNDRTWAVSYLADRSGSIYDHAIEPQITKPTATKPTKPTPKT